ncbi:MAG TPA: DUF3471 domain-containing protein, partial [Longimicrobiaceae bacterium]|nr:DUF3471 domain-containing protein [Longimicrobiaceae bacterium]
GLWIPSERLHVIVLANHGRGPERDPDAISQQIAERLLGRAAPPAPFAVAPEALQASVGVYRGREGERRVVTVEGGALFSQRGRNPRMRLTPVGRDEFVFESGTRRRFVRGAGGAVTGMVLRERIGPEELSARTDESAESVLAALAATVTVPVEVLDRYVGAYEFAPNFVLTVRREGTTLRGVVTGQPEVPLAPESETRFSVREANATLVFQVDAAGAVTGVILYQAGREIPARKVR